MMNLQEKLFDIVERLLSDFWMVVSDWLFCLSWFKGYVKRNNEAEFFNLGNSQIL